MQVQHQRTNHHPDNCSCIECEVVQLARNHYFTGKLLVLRDFNDEQRYFIGKDRRHNQRLHGWGTVCGLKVKQHPQDSCQNQWVIIEPGTAIDCCGREIIVAQEQFFDFRAAFLAHWQAQHGRDSQPDEVARTLQICIRYHECTSEQVPAVFDDCGCDDTACQPNRILESYAFDVIVDPEPKPKDPAGVRLTPVQGLNTLNLIRYEQMVLNGTRLYVLTSDDPARLIVFDTDDPTVFAEQALPARARAVVISPDGARAYVAVDQTDPILILDTAALGTAGAEIGTLALSGVTNADLRLVIAPDGMLYALNRTAKQVSVWDNTDTKLTDIPVGNTPQDIALLPAENLLFVADPGDSNVKLIDTSTLTVQTTVISVTGISPSRVLAHTVSGESRLLVIDTTSASLQLVGVQPGLPTPFPPLGAGISLAPQTLVDVAWSSGGRWIYALLQDTSGASFVQVVDAHHLEANDVTNALGAVETVGGDPVNLVLSGDGRHLFAAYDAAPGGVAIFALGEGICRDLFNTIIDGCPSCDDGDCLVLATVHDYVYDSVVTDTRLDNLSDRPLLPSTNKIVEVIRCILDQGVGAGIPGEPGAPGQPGEPGEGIDDVEVEFVPCDQEGEAEIVGASPNRVLKLKIPRGCDGEDGVGTPGGDGEGIDRVEVTFVPCNEPGDAQIVGTSPNRTLVLRIPRGCDGRDGGGERARTGLVTEVVPSLERMNRQPFIIRDIPHCFPDETIVGIMLAYVVRESEFGRFEQYQVVNLLGMPIPAQPGIVYLAARVHLPYDGRFDIVVAHDGQEEQDITIRWVAVPADVCG